MNYLDRNEFNFEPSAEVVEAIRTFNPKDLCFYTRIYDQGKKSVISVRLSEMYGVPEEQVLLGYGGEDILKNAVHYFLMKGDNKTIHVAAPLRCIPFMRPTTPSPMMCRK